MRKIITSVLFVTMILTSCNVNTKNISTNKQRGSYNYVKDNTYYMVTQDGLRYTFGNDSVESNEAYTNRKNRREVEELEKMGLGSFFSGFNFGFGLNFKSIKEKYSEKNYYPQNYIDFDKNLTFLEYNYNKQENLITLNISTNSIIKKDAVKKSIVNEDEIINKINDEEIKEVETTNNQENIDETIEIDDEIYDKIDSMILDENLYDDKEDNNIISTESEIIDEYEEIETIKRLDNLYSIGRNNYYFDKNTNNIYFKSIENEFTKYNIYTYDKEVLDAGLDEIRIYDKDNIVYNKIIYKENGDNEYELVFFSVKNGIEKVYKLPSIRKIIYDDYNKDKVYIYTNDDIRSLYLLTKKDDMKLIDENVIDVYGITKKNIYYSKTDTIKIPYNVFLIDNVSSGEWLGEEPIFNNYKNSDDPLSFDYDIDGYTAARFAYKYKEKFLNDRKKYGDRNIENIKNNNFEYGIYKLYLYDGKNIKEVNENYVRKVYIVDGDKDIVYYETDSSLMSFPITKKTLGEFVTANTLIDQYIEELFEETKKQFLSFVKKDNQISNIKDLDLYRGYIDKMSPLYYDSKYRNTISEKEKRNIITNNNKLYINGVSNKNESSITYSIDLSKDSILFPDTINMDGYDKIKIIDYINEPVYILYNNDNGTLKHGFKTISNNVVVDSVVLNNAKNKIAYIELTDSNVSGILHRVDIKNNYEDYIVSKNAFYYNLCFDSITDELCYIVNFNETEEFGTFLTIDDNNKITFIDDEVTYIIKN